MGKQDSPDGADAKIISLLVKDAKTTISDIARACGLSRQTVAARIRRLETLQIIKGYRAIIDYHRLGLDHFFVLFLKLGVLDEATTRAALEEFRKSHHVLMDCSITGEWDVLQLLAFHNTAEYDEYIYRLRTTYGKLFRDTKSHAVLKFFKVPDEYSPLGDEGKTRAGN